MENNKNLRVLIVEDNKDNILAAREQLKEYQLTIVESFNDFVSEFNGTRYDQNWKEQRINSQAPEKSKYDVVLTDLYFPIKAGKRPEDPLGYSVALIASAASTPYIGIVTSLNHHDGQLAETFDFLTTGGPDRRFMGEQKSYRLNESRLVLFDDDDLGTRGTVKSWGRALESLIEGKRC